ncbi:restriction endonuclease subunit S [Haemophilus parainfluenzae]|uniref:Restriction endonuclease subunit S n=1 Tax=Haemophilus parainfluenzae TaxID=729 RepID=A0AB36E732_HAEPA|nr:restriction endonuclease subunit S [Haemophilus parainfluenzae]
MSANNVKFSGLTKIDDIKFGNQELYDLWMKKEVKKGDLLLTSEAPSGQVMIWDSDEKIILSQRLYALRVNDNFNNKYLKYYIQSEMGQKEIIKNNSGSTVFGISVKTFDNIIVYHPIKDIQEKIGNLLYTIDKKIALNNQINARLEEMAKTLYDYWFVQFDFPDANGKPYKSSGGEMVFDETLKRKIPKGWEVKSLNQVADIVMGQSPDGASYNLEQEGTIFFQGSTDFDWRFPNVRQYTTSPTRFAQKGDILLSVRAPVGDLNIAPFECCIGRGLAALRSKSGNNSFLFYVMKYFKTVFERRNTEGTTFGSITKDDLHSLKLVAPADNVLEKYNEIASKYDEMIFIRSQQNHQLTQLRDFLLPMLMNGQISVTCSGARDG